MEEFNKNERSRSYRDLTVWKKSMRLAHEVYISTRSFPKEELYGIVSQLKRAAASVPANIAEGQARNSKGEFRQFIGIAQGSLAELETHLLLSQSLKYLTKEDSDNLLTACDEVARLLAGLKKSLQKVITKN